MGLRRDPKSQALILDPESQDVRIEALKKVIRTLVGKLYDANLIDSREAAEIERKIREV